VTSLLGLVSMYPEKGMIAVVVVLCLSRMVVSGCIVASLKGILALGNVFTNIS
jgi:hypothetical protein